MKESNLEKLELCAKAMEEYGNHGAAFYIREAIEEITQRRYMEKMDLTTDDMLMIEALGSEQFSFEAMQERWNISD